jgi:hypothetical protein
MEKRLTVSGFEKSIIIKKTEVIMEKFIIEVEVDEELYYWDNDLGVLQEEKHKATQHMMDQAVAIAEQFSDCSVRYLVAA